MRRFTLSVLGFSWLLALPAVSIGGSPVGKALLTREIQSALNKKDVEKAKQLFADGFTFDDLKNRDAKKAVLTAVIATGSKDLVDLALTSGASPDMIDSLTLRDLDDRSLTTDSLQILLDTSHTDITDDAWCRSLASALTRNNRDCVRLLLQSGTNINCSISKDGDTPLIQAVVMGRLEAVKAAVEAGADVNQANKRGDTPILQAAKRPAGKEIVEFLRGAGAIE